MIAPTMAWVVETGSPALVIQNTAMPAASATMNAPPMALIAPSFPTCPTDRPR